MTIHEILQKYWGFNSFRPFQEEIIASVLDGKDTLAILPTGGGKSVCFQVPALATDGLCLVISPLIALMKDQVENLKRKGIPALAIYSGMAFPEIKKTLQNAAHGNYKFLYVSPERLETRLFLEYLPALHINLLAVDEAHCISQWGYDFRPPYTRIAALRELIPSVPVLALTASATQIVQADICEKLSRPEQTGKPTRPWQRFQQSFARPNLSYSVFNVPSKQNKLLEILNKVKGSAIVYCKSRKNTTEVARLLKMNNISADFYHAGLTGAERNEKQENWINNRIRVIACTNAFGMGIDKPDVRVVVHYDVPDCLENYYQEAGRAGRDGKRAYAVLLYNNKELESLLEQVELRFPAEERIKEVYIAVMNHLQIPAGTGEGMSYDFDMVAFASAFKLDVLTVNYAIKALEQEGFISYNEVFFNPSSVVFTTSKEELRDFENIHPELELLIKGLLRSYEGIFDFPAIIYESKLAKFLHRDVNEIKQSLQQLHGHHIIQYSPQKDTPQVCLLQNRVYTDSYTFNNAGYRKRKECFKQRAEAMIAFVRNTAECRSKLIAAYFNNESLPACAICDNCINAVPVPISGADFEKLSDYVLEKAGAGSIQVKELLAGLKGMHEKNLWKAIDYLLAEEKIRIDKGGNISVKS